MNTQKIILKMVIRLGGVERAIAIMDNRTDMV